MDKSKYHPNVVERAKYFIHVLKTKGLEDAAWIGRKLPRALAEEIVKKVMPRKKIVKGHKECICF